MTKISMALFDDDGYMESFAGYLCRKYRNIMETRVFTDYGMFEKHVREGNADVLLAPESFLEKLRVYSGQVPQMIFLSEGNREREKMDFPVIFKYQAVPEIVTEIFALLAENDKISYRTEIISKRTVEMSCGYAPFGGGGVSEFLFQKAEALAGRAKVLYVNLEEFQGFSHLFRDRQGERKEIHGGMSEVLFYLRQKKGKLALKLESVLYRKGALDCIFSVEDFRDLLAITKEDIFDFLQILLEQTDYEMILFDIGVFSEAVCYLMEKCGIIYMPEPKGSIQISKMEAFEKNLRLSGKEQILEKREWIKIS